MRHKTGQLRQAYLVVVLMFVCAFITAQSLLCRSVAAAPAEKKPAAVAASNGNGGKKNSAETKEKNGEQKETGEVLSKTYSEDDFRPKVETESYASLVFKSLLVIGLLVAGFIAFYRFVTKKIGLPGMGSSAGTVLSVVPLGTNKYLQIVDLAGKILVLGVSDNSVNLITEITDKDEKDRLRLAPGRTSEQLATFTDFMNRHVGHLIKKIPGSGKSDVSKISDAMILSKSDDIDYSFLETQKTRLKKLKGSGND